MTGPNLNTEQANTLRGMMNTDNARPVRFLYNGQALAIGTGQLCDKGTNVIYHPVYWDFGAESINFVLACLPGVKAVKC